MDAGKSTLMGRLLYELGRLDEKTKRANERASEKIGKGSFSWAWGLDGTTEERERYWLAFSLWQDVLKNFKGNHYGHRNANV